MRILSSAPLRGTTTIRKAEGSRMTFAGRVLSECARHDAAVLNGSVGISSFYDELILAAVAARRGTPVLLMDCIWEPGSRRLSRLFGATPMLGVDLLPVGATRPFTALIGAFDHPRLHYAVLSTYERDHFSHTWGVDRDRVHFTPYFATAARATALDDGPTVFAGGDSLRDYRPMVEAAPMIHGDVFIATRLAMPNSAASNLTTRPVTPREYRALSNGARIHVVPLLADSLRSAGQQTYLNAMALGRPVVVTDAPGVRDHIEHGVTGFIVPPNDPNELAATVNALLADKARAERVGATAKRAILSKYTGRHYAERLCQIAGTISRR
jgi:glycosyltransferase involved in cell wall biosynthesis